MNRGSHHTGDGPIESVQAQTYQQWEMIIVDDCSTDNTKEIVDKYIKEDSRIKYFCLENNSGAAVARTKAMELANGEYMAFLDSDDIWPEEKLKKQLAFMKKYDVAFSCRFYCFFCYDLVGKMATNQQ